MLIIILGLIAVTGLYAELSENQLKKGKEEFCRLECRNYSKRY